MANIDNPIPRWQQQRDDETQTEYTVRMVREEPLRDLRERLVRAKVAVDDLATGRHSTVAGKVRLAGKASGIALAISYLDEALR